MIPITDDVFPGSRNETKAMIACHSDRISHISCPVIRNILNPEVNADAHFADHEISERDNNKCHGVVSEGIARSNAAVEQTGML
jgi:hypothetical protein